MPVSIPDATLGATFTNEITGVTYTYDGQKWIGEGGADPSHEHDEYATKSFVDDEVGYPQSIFKFKTPDRQVTNEIEDGEVWCNPNDASTWWVSYKTFYGRRWSVPEWAPPADNESYPNGSDTGPKTIYWTAEGITKPFMTVYDIEENIALAQFAIKKINFQAFLEADGVTEKDKGNYKTHRVNIDIDKSNTNNSFTRPRENSLIRISLPPFL